MASNEEVATQRAFPIRKVHNVRYRKVVKTFQAASQLILALTPHRPYPADQ